MKLWPISSRQGQSIYSEPLLALNGTNCGHAERLTSAVFAMANIESSVNKGAY